MEDVNGLRDQATQALKRGDLDSAANALVTAAAQTHLAESEYVQVLQMLMETLLRRGDQRSALSVAYYFLRSDPARLTHAVQSAIAVPPADRLADGRLA